MNNLIFFLALLLSFNTAQATESTEPLAVTPTQLWSKPSQIHQFTVTGGLSPIYWQTKTGEVTIGEEPNTFIYQAPRRYMQDTIHFFDRAGQEIQVTIDILRPLSITPSIRHIPINGETHFRIQGGSGQWQVATDKILTVTKPEDNRILIVKGGTVAGLHNIQVHDQLTGEQVSIQVQIYAPLEIQEK